MNDLSDEEIKSIERSLGGPGNVLTSRSETCRMLAELQRRRAADLTGDDIEAMRYARHAVGYLFHHEPADRERALGALTAIDKVTSAHGGSR